MKVTYNVYDGYAGGSRPHTVEVDDSDLSACETEQDQIDLIDEAIEEDYRQKCYPYWDRLQLKNAPEPNSLEEEQEDEDD